MNLENAHLSQNLKTLLLLTFHTDLVSWFAITA